MKAKIVVPVVASYPDRRMCLKNAQKCRRLGFDVCLDPVLFRKPPQKKHRVDIEFGSPRDRANRFVKLLKNVQEPCIVATATGGIGTVRTISRLYERMSNRLPGVDLLSQKVVVGFSDSTALALSGASENRGNPPSFHGPCFEDKEFIEALPFYAGVRTSWSLRPLFVDRVDASTVRRIWTQIGHGAIWGGNLTLFNFMLADNEFIAQQVRIDRPILFLEDVYESSLYGKGGARWQLFEMELDRLEFAGVFRFTQLILLGRISGISRRKVLQSLRKYYRGPVVGLDIGHDTATADANLLPPIPLGVTTEIDYRNSDQMLSCRWSAEPIAHLPGVAVPETSQAAR